MKKNRDPLDEKVFSPYDVSVFSEIARSYPSDLSILDGLDWDRMRCFLTLSFLSKYPSLVINLEGILLVGLGPGKYDVIEISKLRRWLRKLKNIKAVEIVKIRRRRATDGDFYQSEEAEPYMIAIKRGTEAEYLLNSRTLPRGRPQHGYRLITPEELEGEDRRVFSSLLKYPAYMASQDLNSVVNRRRIEEGIKIFELSLEILLRLKWLLLQCGLGDFLSQELIRRLQEEKPSNLDAVFETLLKEESATCKEFVRFIIDSQREFESGIAHMKYYEFSEEQMAFECPFCSKRNVIPKKSNTEYLACSACGIELEILTK